MGLSSVVPSIAFGGFFSGAVAFKRFFSGVVSLSDIKSSLSGKLSTTGSGDEGFESSSFLVEGVGSGARMGFNTVVVRGVAVAVKSLWGVTCDITCIFLQSVGSKDETSSKFGVLRRHDDGIFIFCMSHACGFGISGKWLELRFITLFLFQGAMVWKTGHSPPWWVGSPHFVQVVFWFGCEK